MDLKEIFFNNKRKQLNSQKNLGIEQHNKRKQKMQDYSQKRRKIAKPNLKIHQFKFLIKVGFSPSKKTFYLLQWKHFKNDEKCFLFRLKILFRSQDI